MGSGRRVSASTRKKQAKRQLSLKKSKQKKANGFFCAYINAQQTLLKASDRAFSTRVGHLLNEERLRVSCAYLA